MRILAWYLAVLIFLLCTKNLQAQDLGIRSYKIEELEKKKIAIEDMEREARASNKTYMKINADRSRILKKSMKLEKEIKELKAEIADLSD